MNLLISKWSVGAIIAITVTWMGYELMAGQGGLDYFSSKPPRFWLAFAGSIAAVALASLVIRKKFGPKTRALLLGTAALILAVLVVWGGCALVWAATSRDLQLTSKEMFLFAAVLGLLAFMAIVCWLAKRVR